MLWNTIMFYFFCFVSFSYYWRFDRLFYLNCFVAVYLLLLLHPGFNATHGKYEGGENKFTSSVGTQNYILPPLQTDYNHTFVSVHHALRISNCYLKFWMILRAPIFLLQPQLAVTFPDQPLSSVMSTYVPQALVRPLFLMEISVTCLWKI